MNICVPVNEDKGLQSSVCAHFGSAPFYLIVDMENDQCRAISNKNQHHAHGTCRPLNAIAGEKVDCVVVGGIGMGALYKLMAAGIQVFLAEYPTVQENLSAYRAGTLSLVSPERACSGHGRGQGPHGLGPRGKICSH